MLYSVNVETVYISNNFNISTHRTYTRVLRI